jgi:hypothetical protein
LPAGVAQQLATKAAPTPSATGVHAQPAQAHVAEAWLKNGAAGTAPAR